MPPSSGTNQPPAIKDFRPYLMQKQGQKAELGTAQNTAMTQPEVDFNFNEIAGIIGAPFKKEATIEEQASSDSDVPVGENEAEGSAEIQNTDSEVESEQEENPVSQEQDSQDQTAEESTDSEETEETKSEDEEEVNGLPKGVKKRIDKLAAKKRELEDKLKEIEEENQRLRQEAERPVQTVQQPTMKFENLNTEAEIEQQLSVARNVRRFCELNPNGATQTLKDGSIKEYSAEEIAEIKVNAIDAIENDLPARRAYLQTFRQAEQLAKKEYTFWNDKSSQEYQLAQTVLRNNPSIKQFPDYMILIGDLLSGMKARVGKQQQAGKTQQAVKSAPIQPRPTVAPARAVQKQTEASKASLKRFAASGSNDDMADYIAKNILR